MTISENPVKKKLHEIASNVLALAQDDILPPEVLEALQSPTLGVLQTIGLTLLAAKQFNTAEQMFLDIQDFFGNHFWITTGLARIATAREDWEAAAIAWRSCLSDFPNRAAPQWFTELARAERLCGHYAEAEAQLRCCLEKFTDFAPAAAALADLLYFQKRHEMAVEAWDNAIQRFPQVASPAWYIGLASAWRALGDPGKAERVLGDMAGLYPGTAAALTHQAKSAGARKDWESALTLWTECIDRFETELKPAWLNARANALFQLRQVEQAIDGWRDALQIFPDDIGLRQEMAKAARDLGQWTIMRECFDYLISRFPHLVSPAWLAGQARGLMMEQAHAAAALAIAGLIKQFSESPLGHRLAVDHCYARLMGVGSIAEKLDAGLLQHPKDRLLRAEQIRVLLACRRMVEAESILLALEYDSDDHLALISRWRFEIDRHGENILRAMLPQIIINRNWTIEAAIAITNFLLSLWSIWPVSLAKNLLDDMAGKFPGNIKLSCARARVSIALRQNNEALQLIETIPALYQFQDIMELRGWAAYQRGDYEPAKQIWQKILSMYYFPATSRAETNLMLLTPERAALPPDDVTAFMSFHNEMAHLPEFLRHHRQLGVQRFVCVDNMSTDEGPAFLIQQPDVILYQTDDDFHASGCGVRWINILRDRHGEGGWCLYLDADECFTYPGWETTPLGQFTAYLDQEGAEAVGAFMLDVYPERLTDDTGQLTPLANYRFYDAPNEKRGIVRPPYLLPVGGMRERLFGVYEYLQKIPLIRHGKADYINSHSTTPVKLSAISGVLLHYKLFNMAKRLQPLPGPESNPCLANHPADLMRRHVRYAARMADLLNANLRQPGLSEALAGSSTLADRGLMSAPFAYKNWPIGVP